jgi:hypothetical protein
MIKVGRAINGIGLNGREWLLNEDNSLMKFKDKEEAKKFLRDAGVDLTDEEMEDTLAFEEIEE